MSSKLEIATFTPSSALSALRSGAQRIELCAHKNQDGLTPAVKDFSRIYSALDEKPGDHDDGKIGKSGESGEINIMIRPVDNSLLGGGPNDNFRVGGGVFEEMRGEIRRFRELGGRGFVFGVLRDGGGGEGLLVDRERCAELIGIAREGEGGENVRCTFHRAFDRIDPLRMEEQLEVVSLVSFIFFVAFGFCLGVIFALRRSLARKNDLINLAYKSKLHISPHIRWRSHFRARNCATPKIGSASSW